MRYATLFAVAWLSSVAVASEPGDPSGLAVPREKSVQAAKLVKQLDDDAVAVRDGASDGLAKMGRFALPAIRQALVGKPSVEVKNRIRRLMMSVAGQDFEVRYPVFLADKMRKYAHDFLGWTELKALAGDTESSRALLADILTDKQSRTLLLVVAAAAEEALKTLNARREEYGPKLVKGKGWVQGTPALHDVAALFLVETAIPDLLPRFHSVTAFYGIQETLGTAEGKSAATGKGKYGTVFQAICRRWVESSRNYAEYLLGDQLCIQVNLGKELRTGIRLRIVDDPNISAAVKQNALLTLAETGGRKHLNLFRQFLKDDTLILPGMPDDKIQLRDMALCAAVLVTGQIPKDYGFTVVIGEVPQHLFMAHNYRFTEGKGKSMDDLRKVAFAKWAEWEKEHLKPDVKK